MAPLSMVTRVAAGSKQNKAEMRLVVWPLTLVKAHLYEPNLIPHTLSLSVPDHDPCPSSILLQQGTLQRPVRKGSIAFFPHCSSPLLHLLWFSGLRFLLQAGKKGGRTSRSWLDMFLMWMIYCMCVKTFILFKSVKRT